METSNDQIITESNKVELFLKREDLIHPHVSGNKFRKLKYNLLQAKADSARTLLTFGGAFSNHIAAVAYAGHLNGLKTIGVIRGEELSNAPLNPTLAFAVNHGMALHFINRDMYRQKSEPDFLNALKMRFGDFYLLPEGGTNRLAVKGCEEILTAADAGFDYICCAVGTGGTLAGIANSATSRQKVIGFAALKGDFLPNEIKSLTNKRNWQINNEYHFGGYAKANAELVNFINDFGSKNKIALDPVYTGKMMFGIADLIRRGYFPDGSRILAIHTGGLQGIAGMNLRLTNKNMQLDQNG